MVVEAVERAVSTEAKFDADAYERVFGPRLAIEGGEDVSPTLVKRATQPIENKHLVDLAPSVQKNYDALFDSERKFIQKLLSGYAS